MKTSNEKSLELIQKIPFFQGFAEVDKELISTLCYFEQYPAGTVIINETDINRSLYFLIRGKVDVSVQDEFCRQYT